MILAWLLLLTGLTISAVAIYYSVVGLTAIFAAAALPIIVMGTTLEVAKLVCASWLKANWDRVPGLMKTYMTIAVIVLMVITSMGIFGFLSKAHMDQSLVSGDVQSKVAIIDEKIATERSNIEAAKKALAQMDATVDQTIARSTNEAGAGRAAQLRRTQAKERATLQADIAKSQKNIIALNDEAAPIRAEIRKVEAEVGPIKYIAAFVYGDNPDANILERAVTWVIMIIVLVFDPLAVIMLLAAQMTFQWHRNQKYLQVETAEKIKTEPTVGPITNTTDTETKSETTPSTALGGDITAPEETEVPGTSETELTKWNKMVEEAEKAVQEETVEDRVARGETYIDQTGTEILLPVEEDDSKKKKYMTKDETGRQQIKDRN